MGNSIYQTSPIKRHRRTKADMEQLRAAIYEVLEEIAPATLRQTFYQLVTRGHIEKLESEYDAVGRQLVEMRLSGNVPWSWIVDNGRWMRKPTTHDSIKAALQETASTYRRALWRNISTYCEVWCEKDALTGVIYEVTKNFDVPLMVSRGFASLSYIHEAAESIVNEDKPAYIYYLGDHDPSGLAIDMNIEARLREFAPYADITFERVAVLPEQIEQWDEVIPTPWTRFRGALDGDVRSYHLTTNLFE